MNAITKISPKITSPLNFKADQPVKQQIIQTDRFEPSFEGKGSKVAAGIGAFALLLSILGLAGCSNEPAQKPAVESPAKPDAAKLKKSQEALIKLQGSKQKNIDFKEFVKCFEGFNKTTLENFIKNYAQAGSEDKRKKVMLDFLISEGFDKKFASETSNKLTPKLILPDNDDDLLDLINLININNLLFFTIFN